MAQGRSRSLAFLMGAIGTLVPMQGCVDDGVSFHVICPIPPAVDDDGCTWDASGETCLAGGTLNLRAAGQYSLTLRVESGLIAREREVPPRGEPNGMQVTKARVELRNPAGARIVFDERRDQAGKVLSSALPNPFEVVATGFLAPGGRTPVTLVAVPPDYVVRLRDTPEDVRPSQIVAAVQLRGKTNGDVDVESGQYEWPVRLINASTTANEGCVTPDAVCRSLFGQDGFANVCTP